MAAGTLIWASPSETGNYTVIIDADDDGYYYTDKDFIDITLEIAEATIIKLSSFEAVPGNRVITINWTTESEVDNAGFNIYRAEEENGEYIQINDSLISSEGSPTEGASYEVVDEDVMNRFTYYYKLEDIDLNGTSTMHDPVSATPRLIYILK